MDNGERVVRVGILDSGVVGRTFGGEPAVDDSEGTDARAQSGGPAATCGLVDHVPTIRRLLGEGRVADIASRHGCRLEAVDLTSLSALADSVSSGGLGLLFVVLCRRGGGVDGVEVVRRLVRPCGATQVIYVDTTGANASRAYETPHAYLIGWPPNPGDFARAIDRGLALLERWQERPVIVRIEGVDHVLSPSAISFIESDKRILRVHFGRNVVEAYGKLDEVASMLPSIFVSPHKSFLVNLSCVREIADDELTLATGEKIPVSRRRGRALRKALSSYVRRLV